jgi:hypothetical protein
MQKSRTGYLTVAWAGIYAVVCLIWTMRGSGYPAGTGDGFYSHSLLRAVPASTLALITTVLAAGVAVLAFAMSGRHPVRLGGVPRKAVLILGWLVVALLLFGVPDVRLLTLAGYAPMLILGAPFGLFKDKVDYDRVFNLPLAHQLWCVLGGVLLALTLLAWQRYTRNACVACGGSGDRIVVWGRRAAYVAAAIPVLYALTRFAWLAGIPLGLTTESMTELRESGAVWAGAGLGAFAVVGAILTLGLVQPWGERMFGRRVPVNLAVVPAVLVAIIVMQASISLFTSASSADLMGAGLMTLLPMALWPLWSVALLVAAIGYQRRRRGPCAQCQAR